MISRWARTGLGVAAALLVLAGCGDDPATTAADPSSDSSETTSETTAPSETPTSAEPTETTPPAPPLPACSDIWVDDGRKLPAGYRGCSENGTDVPADSRECSFGKDLVIYGGHFYAVPNGPINRTAKPLAQDPDYKSALSSCTA
jgi:hypothetical protein